MTEMVGDSVRHHNGDGIDKDCDDDRDVHHHDSDGNVGIMMTAEMMLG